MVFSIPQTDWLLIFNGEKFLSGWTHVFSDFLSMFIKSDCTFTVTHKFVDMFLKTLSYRYKKTVIKYYVLFKKVY